VDRLHQEVLGVVGGDQSPGADRFALFARVWELTEAASAATPRDPVALVVTGVSSREPIPHLSEPWYC
jgi:hypothetical protein